MFSDPRLTNFIANLLTALAVGAMLLAALYWALHRPYFTIRHVELLPMEEARLQYVSPTTVEATIAGRLSGNFFSMDLNQVRKVVESAPWVRKARIKRVWPDRLVVHIEEQQPLAYWNEGEMINTWGEAFVANEAVLADGLVLPQLNGPASSERLVVQRYAELARWVAPLGLNIREVSLSPRYAWEVVLSDGVRLNLGRDPAADIADPHGRSGAVQFAERMQRFVQIWPSLAERLGERRIASADLRYKDGFAIVLDPQTITSVKQ